MEKIEKELKKFNKKIQANNELLSKCSPLTFFSRKINQKSYIPKSLSHFNSEKNSVTINDEEDTLDFNCERIDNLEKTCEEKIDEQVSDISIGISCLPMQIQRKFKKSSFSFTLMIVGQSGLGKSTFINSLFSTTVYNQKYQGPTQRAKKTLFIDSTTVLLKENLVNVLLNVVDTPGFGDFLNNSNCWQPIENYIEKQYREYFNSELYLSEKTLIDQRIHCCLYFIQATGHTLKEIDLVFMKKLCKIVNLIPVIGKADTFTAEELDHFKEKIRDDLKKNDIGVYQFSDNPSIENETEYNEFRKKIPFGIVSSNHIYQREDGRKICGRKYPWGIIDIENSEHCDFKALRDLLIKYCMYELVDHTHRVHYENYRKTKLQQILKI